jgi:hypothetical protein
MTHLDLHTFNSSLQSLPVAMVFTRRLLLTEKSSVTAAPAPSEAIIDDLTKRATEITVILKEIRGYYHGGLNE